MSTFKKQLTLNLLVSLTICNGIFAMNNNNNRQNNTNGAQKQMRQLWEQVKESMGSNKIKEAIDTLRTLIAKYDSPDAMNNIGLRCLKQSQLHLDQERSYKKHGKQQLVMQCYYQQLKLQNFAEECFKLAADKYNDTNAMNNLGLLYQKQHLWNLAEPCFKLATDKYNDTNAMNNLGLLYQELNQPDLAKKYFKLAADKYNDTNAMNNLGLLYQQYNLSDLAEPYFKLAADKYNDTNAMNNLGLFYYKLGKPDLTEKYFKLAAYKYNDTNAMNNLRDFKNHQKQMQLDKNKSAIHLPPIRNKSEKERTSTSNNNNRTKQTDNNHLSNSFSSSSSTSAYINNNLPPLIQLDKNKSAIHLPPIRNKSEKERTSTSNNNNRTKQTDNNHLSNSFSSSSSTSAHLDQNHFDRNIFIKKGEKNHCTICNFTFARWRSDTQERHLKSMNHIKNLKKGNSHSRGQKRHRNNSINSNQSDVRVFSINKKLKSKKSELQALNQIPNLKSIYTNNNTKARYNQPRSATPLPLHITKTKSKNNELQAVNQIPNLKPIHNNTTKARYNQPRSAIPLPLHITKTKSKNNELQAVNQIPNLQSIYTNNNTKPKISGPPVLVETPNLDDNSTTRITKQN